VTTEDWTAAAADTGVDRRVAICAMNIIMMSAPIAAPRVRVTTYLRN
jgi:hypothetical protein